MEHAKYVLKFSYGPGLIAQSIDLFDNVIEFVKNLNPEIRSNIKFRTKGNYSHDTEKKFKRIFGKNSVSSPSNRNTFLKTISDSKLIIHTYPLTAFSESMYSNVPTILILNKNNWLLSKQSLNTWSHLMENKIAFDNFKDAKSHINKTWNQLDIWWNKESVQFARKSFLSNYFNVKSNWYKEWSNYIYSTKNI